MTLNYSTRRLTRRAFLQQAAAGATVSAVGLRTLPVAFADEASTSEVAFFVVGDTHYLANRERPSEIDAKSADVCGRLVETLNQLAGTEIPEAAGGGKVLAPAGVIHAGESGRPVVLTHHVDIARYSVACDPQAAPDSKEWDPCDVQAFHKAIKDYKVAGIFYGHTHARSVFQWDGASAKAKSGIRVFNNDNSSHFASDAQAFFYVESRGGKLLVREYQTKDRWQTGFWTPMNWRA